MPFFGGVQVGSSAQVSEVVGRYFINLKIEFMSLNVYLNRKLYLSYDNGKTYIEKDEEVYWANITHNLTNMAGSSGLHLAIWRPSELLNLNSENNARAKDIVSFLEKGLICLKEKPRYFENFNPSNGWGSYDFFVSFVENYLNACKEYPEAIVRVSG